MLRYLIIFFFLLNAFTLNAQTFNGATGAVPDNGITATCFPVSVSAVTSPINGSYGLATICLNITHTWDADLEIQLIAPDGTIVPLSIQNGGSANDYTNTCFTSTAPTSIIAGAAPFTGTK